METSHVISDALLCLVGIFVFFRYLSKLPLVETLLWESFILSVAVAAFFGAIRFASVEAGAELSGYFQVMAATVGALGLLTVTWLAVLGKTGDKTLGYGVLLVGFLLFALEQMLNMTWLSSYIPLIVIPLVLISGILALIKGKTQLGIWLIAGVVFAALATFRERFVADPENAIDVYHYLLALSLLSFGLAASKTENRS